MTASLRALALFGFTALSAPAMAASLEGVLYKSPYCTCCEGHADYLRANDVAIEIREVEDLDAVSRGAGIPAARQGCHTILMDGYVFEGHITIDLIRKLLDERPADVVGLSLPGMPTGVPGMGGEKTGPYEVFVIKRDGTSTVYGVQ